MSTCSQESLCTLGEGDCDNNAECEGSLVCGRENCASGSSGLDCCTMTCTNDTDCLNQECNIDFNYCHLDSYSTDWSKCSQGSPCANGDGDCDHDSDCDGKLICGNNNCEDGPTGMDCCTGKFVVLLCKRWTSRLGIAQKGPIISSIDMK